MFESTYHEVRHHWAHYDRKNTQCSCSHKGLYHILKRSPTPISSLKVINLKQNKSHKMTRKLVLTFESVSEIPKCDHSNESYLAVLSGGAVYFRVQSGSNFWFCGWNPNVWGINGKLPSSTFHVMHWMFSGERIIILFMNLRSRLYWDAPLKQS